MLRTSLLAFSIVLAMGGCAPEDYAEEPERLDDRFVVTQGTALAPMTARVVIEPESAEVGQLHAPGGPPVIVYMNRNGGVYTPGTDSATANRSSITNQTAQIQPWNVSEAGWAEVMAHTRQIWAPFNVTITDVDPGSTPHYESIMAGNPGDIGLDQGILGVSPYLLDCGLINNSIVYTFADYAVQVLGNDYREIAEIAAQEVAHSFGLDHQLLASDPMTYLPYNSNRGFKNEAANCGEDNPRACGIDQNQPCTNLGVAGSNTQQNSYMALMERVGGSGNAPPGLSIDTPTNGATVAPGFDIGLTTLPAGGATIVSVDLFIDGNLVQTLTAPPFTFTTPADLALGSHQILVRATDSNGGSAETQISVNVSNNADPNDPNNPGDPNDPTGDGSQLVGGCSTGGHSGTGGALLLLALLWRRRSAR